VGLGVGARRLGLGVGAVTGGDGGKVSATGLRVGATDPGAEGCVGLWLGARVVVGVGAGLGLEEGAVTGAGVTSKSGRSSPNGGKVLSTGLCVGETAGRRVGTGVGLGVGLDVGLEVGLGVGFISGVWVGLATFGLFVRL
jgi:hypothetical protein